MAANDTQPNMRRSRLSKIDALLTAIVFVIALGLYVRTLAPGILMGDSGEFQVLAITGGLAHATGYPIYLLIAKLFTFLPIGPVTWRVDFLSALMGAAGAMSMASSPRSC
jgi:hypothetical protein